MGYYFVFYKCKRYTWRPKETGGGLAGFDEFECQALINKHPLQFQIDCNEMYGKEHETTGGYTAKEEYTVVNWILISRNEYLKYKYSIG